MSIENRPYVGTWRLDTKEVVRYTPDALVYINGNLDIPGCPTCGGRVDLQQYITSVGVEPSTEPISTANIAMHIPRSTAHAFFRDGQFVLTPGLEINIYYRGYFPVKGILADVPLLESGGIDVRNAVMYPYYHVFHGIVTEVSHEYSGGEHTASMSCADMLHFWQYQRIATKGSLGGPSPKGSKIKSGLQHNFTSMTPYSIIYTLFRDVMGSAGGKEMTFSGNVTNAAMNASSYDQSMHQMTMLYWEERFSTHFNNLRMYGMDGTLYNSFQQAFLSRLSTNDSNTLVKQYSDPTQATEEHDILQGDQAVARAVGYDPLSSMISISSRSAAQAGQLGLNVAQMQAFVVDYNGYSVNLYETEYQTKLDIASTIRELTGFEFYQDVDGDFVFKPPYYNLDTSSSRTYVIKDIDIISFSCQEGEPAVTTVKATADYGVNSKLMGGEMGKRAEFVDFRLVAKYGWRSQDFETAYMPNAQAMYYACINRMDLFNIGVKSASCQIPLRPELRAGYPVYIEYLDCFFYLQSMSHAFQFGGQCTTSLNLVGRRAKWHAPGNPPASGKEPTIKDIHLDDPWLPSLPLQVEGSEGIPRLQGFPNVVMALDPDLLNPDFWAVGVDLTNLSDPAQMQALILKALSFGVLEIDTERTQGKSGRDKKLIGPYLLRESNDVARPVGTSQDLLQSVQTYQKAQNEQNVAQGSQQARETVVNEESQAAASNAQLEDVQAIIDAVTRARATGIEGGDQAANYLDTLMNLKDSFNPHANLPGYYRYYSSSHPDPSQQGMKELISDDTTGTVQTAGNIELEVSTKVFGFADTDEGNVLTNPNDPNDPIGGVTVTRGIPLMKPNTGVRDAKAVPTPTHQISTIGFVQHYLKKSVAVQRQAGHRNPSWPSKNLQSPAKAQFQSVAASLSVLTIRDRFWNTYEDLGFEIESVHNDFAQTSGEALEIPTFDQAIAAITVKRVPLDPDTYVVPQYRDDATGVLTISKALAKTLSDAAAAMFKREFNVTKEQYGVPGKNKDGGSRNASPDDKTAAFGAIDVSWAALVGRFSGGEFAGVPQTSDKGTISITLPEDNETNAQYSAVFPVSDHRGYEVIGTYAYGRGLSIEPGGSFEQLGSSNRFDNVSLEAVNAFLDKLKEDSSPSKAIGLLAQSNPEAAAEIVASGFDGEFSGSEVINDLDYFGDLFDIRFRAYSSSSAEFSQKQSVTNAAYSLADMGLQSSHQVCECKGAEADQLLLAFGNQGFVNVDQPDEVSSFVADQMEQQGLSWKSSQDGLRGRVLDTRNTVLSDAFQAIANKEVPGAQLVSSGQGQLEAEAAQARQDAAAIQAGLQDTFNIDEEG